MVKYTKASTKNGGPGIRVGAGAVWMWSGGACTALGGELNQRLQLYLSLVRKLCKEGVKRRAETE